MRYGKVYMTFGCHGVASRDECIDGGVSFYRGFNLEIAEIVV